MRDLATCRSCGEPIRFVRTIHGKVMPINREPDPDGNVELIDGRAVVHPHGVQTLGDAPRFVAHFTDCPQAKEWRSKP